MESGAGYQVQTTSNWIEQDWWNLWSSQNRKRCRRPNMRCSKRNLREKNRTGKRSALIEELQRLMRIQSELSS